MAINEKCHTLQAEGKETFHLNSEQSPFPVPEPGVNALAKQVYQVDYLAVKGLYELRKAIAAYWRRKQGLKYNPENIIIGPGTKELFLLLQLVDFGDLVIPTPSCTSYFPQSLITNKGLAGAFASKVTVLKKGTILPLNFLLPV